MFVLYVDCSCLISHGLVIFVCLENIFIGIGWLRVLERRDAGDHLTKTNGIGNHVLFIP